jgi:hypothetical protein
MSGDQLSDKMCAIFIRTSEYKSERHMTGSVTVLPKSSDDATVKPVTFMEE